MEQRISFFNWSLSKILRTESDSLNRARIKIIFVILIFSLVKIFVAIPVLPLQFPPNFQLGRVCILLVVYVILLKLLLVRKAFFPAVTHTMVWMGLLLIWTNIIFTSPTLNIITVQFIFMLVLSSFYLLNNSFAILYSLLGILPAVLSVFLSKYISLSGKMPAELASPSYEIIVFLNFATIVIGHYLFSNAFKSTIEEKEKLNGKLRLAVQEANLAAESKSDFLSTMSHELRTPLNSVLGISEIMLKESQDSEQTENLRILKFSAENLHSLINDILDYNKLGSDKLELETISVDLFEVISNVSSGLRFQAEQKGIDFILDLDENIIGRRIITDPTRITQIIYNLGSNAIKFTEQGNVSLNLKMLRLDPDHISIRFSVIDTGIGIIEGKQQFIFEPFTQASSSTTRKFGGTGLGLAIVKRLLMLFQSQIHLDSTPGAGSTFYFDITFKLDKVPETAITISTESEYSLSALRILVAEDNQMNRLLLTKILSRWGNVPVFAFNGREAIDEVAGNNYDVVLMDLHMPEVNGYEAALAIRALADPVKSKIPIIAITAAVADDLYSKITLAGMDDYIHKPFKMNELYGKLKRIATGTV